MLSTSTAFIEIYMVILNKIIEYIKLVIFVSAVLVGIQVPSFFDQYGQNLHARVSESAKSIEAFRDDAEKYFGGDLKRLVAHYEKQSDPVFVSGGESISSLLARNILLAGVLEEFNRTYYSAYLHVFLHPVAELRQDVWNNYSFTVVLNGASILVGILIAILLLACFEISLYSCACGCKKLIKPKSKSAHVGHH